MTTPKTSEDKNANSILKEFDELYTLPQNMVAGPQREKAIKRFILQAMKEAASAMVVEETNTKGREVENLIRNDCRQDQLERFKSFFGEANDL